jgi:hypothetical protein
VVEALEGETGKSGIGLEGKLNCQWCGHRLRGTDRAAACPGCGNFQPMSEPLSGEAEISVKAPMEKGLVCSQCGYDLRASMEAGACPECGARIVSPRSGMSVDLRQNVVVIYGTVARFPARCIKTNEPVTGEAISYRLQADRRNLPVSALFNKEYPTTCVVTYYLSPRVQQNVFIKRQLLAIGFILFSVAILALEVSFHTYHVMLTVACPVVIIGGIMTLCGVQTPAGTPLSICGVGKGIFVLKGFSHQFLRALKEETEGMM